MPGLRVLTFFLGLMTASAAHAGTNGTVVISIKASDEAGASATLRPSWESWPCYAAIEAIDHRGRLIARKRMAIPKAFGSRGAIVRGDGLLTLTGRIRWLPGDPFLAAIAGQADFRVVAFHRSIDSTGRAIIGRLLSDD